ncbi:MAG: c-type cytochrome [Cyclobacteriaceae bacterium]
MRNLQSFFALICLLAACSGGTQNEEATAESEETVTEEETPQVDAQLLATGETVYNQYCLACHQANGQGVPGAFPPLTQTEWVLGDDIRLITIVLQGLQGEITVNGETYNNIMAPHAFLTDDQVAGVLTYVRNSFGNKAEAIAPEEVAEVRASIES